jgi:hypothetical protein
MALHRSHDAWHALTDEVARLERPPGAQGADDGVLIANGIGKRPTVVGDAAGEDS